MIIYLYKNKTNRKISHEKLALAKKKKNYNLGTVVRQLENCT